MAKEPKQVGLGLCTKYILGEREVKKHSKEDKRMLSIDKMIAQIRGKK